jgi:hypothetical protein
MRRLLVLLLLVLADRAAFAGACAQPSIAAALVLPSPKIPTTGAVLVMLAGRFGDRAMASSFDKLQATLVHEKETIDLKVDVIAPGLARLVPARKPTPGEWKVTGIAEPTMVTFVDAKPAAMWPEVKRVGYVSTQVHMGSSGTATGSRLVLTTEKALPEGIASVVIFDEKGTALMSAPTIGEGTELTLFVSPQRCGVNVPGVTVPSQEQKVQVAFVTSAGEMSPKSKTITVAKP